MKIAFVVNARNKAKWVYRACAAALAQTVPCEILLSDQGSTDGTMAEIERALADALRGAYHMCRILRCQITGAYGMAAMNDHMDWIITQTDADWIFQSSADDYSLPDRVRVCMEAVEKNPCSAVATTMFFEEPDTIGREQVSGYPRESGYVKAGDGITRLAYGSTIAGYSREFLLKIGSAGRHTPDVYWGYLAALEKGFYVVANPQHVHVNHVGLHNTGFQGRLRAATGDDALRVAELNHFQLFSLYLAIADRAQQLHPEGIGPDDWLPLINTCLMQAKAWSERRNELHEGGVSPGVI